MPDPTTPLACAHCSTALEPEERFCSACGHPVAADAPDESPWVHIVSQLSAATLGEFEVARELGRGGMAAVYLAHEIALNRLVAIKVMAPGLFLGPGMVDRFRQEAVTVANLSHPNIITIHAVRQIEDLHFLVMKFIEGRSLEAVLHSHGPLPVDVVRAVLFQVGSGLAYAHRRGVIHRDIKPANILLDGDGNAIVTDFGIAKLTEQEGHTQTGTMIGTPAYMSPEQCVGGGLTWSSDLYSLGVVAYELLTGTVPFTGNAFAVMQAHTTTPPPSVIGKRPDCPPELDAAILRMLAKTPAERFDGMAAALDALGAAPLREGDPVRATLEGLALPDPAARKAATIRPAVSPIPRAGPRVGQLALVGVPDIVAAGDRFELQAVVRSDSGATLPGRVVLWSTSDDAVAAVTANGLVTLRAPGRVNITAMCEGVLASLPITVLPAGTGRRITTRTRWITAGVAMLLIGAGAWWLRGRPITPSTTRGAQPPARNSDTSRTSTVALPPPAAPPPPVVARPKATTHSIPPTAAGVVAKRTTGSPRNGDSTVRLAAADSATPPPATVHPPAAATVAAAASTTPAAASLPPPPPPPPSPSPAEITRDVQVAVQAYVDAIRARSIDQMRKIYPGLAADRANEWQTQFNMIGREGIEQLGVTVVGDVKVTPAPSGESAVAQFTLDLVLKQRKGDSQTSRIAFRAALRHDTGAWRFDALEQRAVH